MLDQLLAVLLGYLVFARWVPATRVANPGVLAGGVGGCRGRWSVRRRARLTQRGAGAGGRECPRLVSRTRACWRAALEGAGDGGVSGAERVSPNVGRGWADGSARDSCREPGRAGGRRWRVPGAVECPAWSASHPAWGGEGRKGVPATGVANPGVLAGSVGGCRGRWSVRRRARLTQRGAGVGGRECPRLVSRTRACWRAALEGAGDGGVSGVERVSPSVGRGRADGSARDWCREPGRAGGRRWRVPGTVECPASSASHGPGAAGGPTDSTHARLSQKKSTVAKGV